MKCFVVLNLLMIVGCAQLQQTKSEELDQGVYRLSTIGNVFASSDELHKKLNERAARICGGSERYQYLSEVEIKEFEQETNQGGVSATGSYQVYSRLVKCNNEK